MIAVDRAKWAALSTGPQPAGTAFAVSPHHLASQAAIDIMASGGNAVDGSIATNAVLAVVLPDTCGPGGDLFALVHIPGEGSPRTLNASGRAGSGFTANDIRDLGHGAIPRRSPWSVTVPGCVDGWMALSAELGQLPLAQVLQPAIDIAREGFSVSTELGASLSEIRPLIVTQPSATPFYPNGTPAHVGSTISRARFADTLEAIATDGRDGFYRGVVANGIVEATGGAITRDDLAVNQAEWIEPASLDLFGRTAWTIPPNSQGYLTLATLWIFEQLDPPEDPFDPLFHHLLIEAYRSVAWERAQFVSDATTAPLDVAALLDPNRLQAIASTVVRDAAGRWPQRTPAPGGTAYMAAADGHGMAVSYIQSNFSGIGSGLSAADTGVFLHNRGAGFNLIQGHPNEYMPGRRPMHTLAPTLWTGDGGADLVLGTRGGDQQPQFLAQFAALHFHAGLCTDDSQQFPRWNMEQPLPGTDSRLTVENPLPPTTVDALASMGHVVESVAAWNPDYGPISAIDLADEHKASADPRISTSAALSKAAR